MPATSERNEKLKAAMRDENTGNLNTSGKEGVIVRSPSQSGGVKRPNSHVEPGTGRKS